MKRLRPHGVSALLWVASCDSTYNLGSACALIPCISMTHGVAGGCSLRCERHDSDASL